MDGSADPGLALGRHSRPRSGETQPVTLTIEQKAQLLLAIEQWSVRTPGGFTALPEGIYDLRNGLHNDLHDAREL